MAYIIGTENNDTLAGTSEYFDTVTALGGNDLVTGGFGTDNVAGDAGNDTVYGGFQADNVSGGDGNDSLYGGSAGDYLYAGLGDDNLFGGGGNDTIGQIDLVTTLPERNSVDGGSGIDSVTLTYATLTQAINVTIGDWIDVQTFNGNTTVVNVETFNLSATAFDDRVSGGIGTDALFGLAGNDTLAGSEMTG